MGKRGDVSDQLVLKRKTKSKIDFLRRKPNLRPEEVYNLIKSFFKSFFDNDYEYTREELLDELDTVYLRDDDKQRFIEMINRLGRIEFSDPSFSQDELDQMLDAFERTIEALVSSQTAELNLWDKVAKTFKAWTTNDEPDVEAFDADEAIEAPEEDVMQSGPAPSDEEEQMIEHDFEDLLTSFYNSLDDDLSSARVDYEEMKHAYDMMNPDEQESYYDELTQAYEALRQRI
jgi:hypothetical protein